MTQQASPRRLSRSLLLVAALVGLFVAGQAVAIPTCELHCTEQTPCDQVCHPLGSSQILTCASYVCDEPQLPWPVAGLSALVTEASVTEAALESRAAATEATTETREAGEDS